MEPVASPPERARSAAILGRRVKTPDDFVALMSAVMSDLVEGLVLPKEAQTMARLGKQFGL